MQACETENWKYQSTPFVAVNLEEAACQMMDALKQGRNNDLNQIKDL